MHVVLFEPEIAPNTGNIIRLCANTGFQLHLIEPLGFDMEEKKLRRAGLDYREYVDIKRYANFEVFKKENPELKLFAFTTKATRFHTQTEYDDNAALLFGPETRGLPPEVRDVLPDEQKIRLPMLPERRSLNLSNSVAIAIYEAWRQQDFNNAT